MVPEVSQQLAQIRPNADHYWTQIWGPQFKKNIDLNWNIHRKSDVLNAGGTWNHSIQGTAEETGAIQPVEEEILKVYELIFKYLKDYQVDEEILFLRSLGLISKITEEQILARREEELCKRTVPKNCLLNSWQTRAYQA